MAAILAGLVILRPDNLPPVMFLVVVFEAYSVGREVPAYKHASVVCGKIQVMVFVTLEALVSFLVLSNVAYWVW
ncbi:hypothetical protein PRNP1_011568 [Phytophthora ramorum]